MIVPYSNKSFCKSKVFFFTFASLIIKTIIMKRLFANLLSLAVFFILCLFTLNVNAQEVKERKQIYTYVENPPSFPGGEKALSKYFVENIIYPNDDKRKRN